MQRIEAIILAGGAGSRLGGGKLLAPYRGGSLIDGAVRAAFAAPVESVILATGFDRDAVKETVITLARVEGLGLPLKIVHAERFADGMSATLKAGIGATSEAADGAFVFLGDMPNIPHAVAAKVANAIGDHPAAAPVYRGERGHPVLFARDLFSNILQLSGDAGARSLLDELGADLINVDVDDSGVLFDVDRWSDLAQ